MAMLGTLLSCYLLALAALPSVAVACEGGGEEGKSEGKIRVTSPVEPNALKIAGKGIGVITVEYYTGTIVALFEKESISNEPNFKIVHKCENEGKEVVTGLAFVKDHCTSTIEHTTATKGQTATWLLEWNGGTKHTSSVTVEST
jgi:hypothetical protein